MTGQINYFEKKVVALEVGVAQIVCLLKKAGTI